MTLTVAELRSVVNSPALDSVLQGLLDAAWAAIAEVAGPAGAVTEFLHGRGQRRIVTGRQIGTVTSITEDGIALNPLDFRAAGYVLERLNSGPSPSWRWGDDVVVVYTPLDDTAERNRVQLELVRLELNTNPGVTAETIGTWSESYGSGAGAYSTARADILASLIGAGTGMTVID